MEKMPYKFGSRSHTMDNDIMYEFENESVENPAKINFVFLFLDQKIKKQENEKICRQAGRQPGS